MTIEKKLFNEDTIQDKARLLKFDEIKKILEGLPYSPEEMASGNLVKEWKEDGFDVIKKLNQASKPLIEIAGPTANGFKQVNSTNLNKKIYKSNLFPGTPIFNEKTGLFQKFFGKVDFLADSQKLPLKDNAASGIFCSCLSKIAKDESETRQLRDNSIKEAFRALGKGGFLIWQGGVEEDIKCAEEAGFKIVQISSTKTKGEIIEGEVSKYYIYNLIFEK